MPVVYFLSSASGAPTLTGESGKMLGLLDAALIVNNVFSTTNDSTWTDNSVEARLEAGTAFTLFQTPASGDRTYIGMPCKFGHVKLNFGTAGVGGTIVWEYWNGSAWTAIVSLTDGTSGLTANGALTWTPASQTGWAASAINSVTQFWVRIRASANPSTNPLVNYLTVGGWTRAFSGTNKAAYRQGTGSNGFFLRVDDSGTATSGRTVGYETMSDVDTGTALFPTAAQVSGGLFFSKSNAASSSTRNYAIACNEKLLFYWTQHDTSSPPSNAVAHSFGDMKSYKSGDAFGTLHLACDSLGNNRMNAVSSAGATSGHYLARTHAQTGASITASKQGDVGKGGGSGSAIGVAGLTYPHPPDSGLYMSPVFVHESALICRGEIPGLWCPLHAQPLTHLDTFSGSGTLAGKTFVALTMFSAAQIFLETSDTWNT